MHAIERLAEFTATWPAGQLPLRTRDRIALLITDLLAATAAGLPSGLAVAARSAATGLYGPGPARIWLTGTTSSIGGAAMANAAAASALDIDDGHRGAAGHAGAGVIPAVLAVAEAEKADDERIFDAIALGYDVALRVATARPTGTFPTYSSGLWVQYGVAAGVGRLLGLDAGTIAEAMAIAGAEGPISFATGTSRYQGTTVKEVIPPAVTAGLTGVWRARAGATGPRDLLDDPARFDPAIMLGGLGDKWWLENCYLKPYACCRYMHAAVDAIAAMRQPGRKITHLRIETFPKALQLSNARQPATLEAAQYSFHFSCALAAVHGTAALQPVDPTRLNDPEVLELASRTELVAHDDFATSFPAGTPCRVILDHGDGPQAVTVLHPLGDVANPMSAAQVHEKFRRIGAVSLDQPRQERILHAATNLQTAGFAPLFAALGDPSPDNNNNHI